MKNYTDIALENVLTIILHKIQHRECHRNQTLRQVLRRKKTMLIRNCFLLLAGDPHFQQGTKNQRLQDQDKNNHSQHQLSKFGGSLKIKINQAKTKSPNSPVCEKFIKKQIMSRDQGKKLQKSISHQQLKNNLKSFDNSSYQSNLYQQDNMDEAKLDSTLNQSLSKQEIKQNLQSIVQNCFKLEKVSKRQKQELVRSSDRFNNFYVEYQRFLDFKQEAGWYDETSDAKDVLINPKFKLPHLQNQSKNLSRLSMNPFKNDLGLMIKQQNNNINDTEDLEEMKKQRGKAYFMKSDLTTAENYLNLIKMKTLEVNHNSVHNFHHAAIKEFNNSHSDAKLIRYTKPVSFPLKKLRKFAAQV
eukprot:403372480